MDGFAREHPIRSLSLSLSLSALFFLSFFLSFSFSFFLFSSRHIFHGIAVNTAELVFRRQSVAIERASSQLIDLLRRPALSRSYLHTQPTTYILPTAYTQKRHDLIQNRARKRNEGTEPTIATVFVQFSAQTERQRASGDKKIFLL